MFPLKLPLRLHPGLPQAEFSQDFEDDPFRKYLITIGTYCFENSQNSPILLTSIKFVHPFSILLL
jgi:hypothetical protein